MVAIEGLGRLLAEHPFFQDMKPDVRDIVVGCCANAHYRPGEFLFKEGGKADHFYLIRQGTVGVEVHVPGRPGVVVETIGEGDIIGWSWLVPPYVWSFDARAMDQVRAITIDGACLRPKLEANHELGYEMYKRFIPIMGRRIGEARLRIVELTTEPGRD
ncbi:CRP-like cAMP-binding protein [Azospirillum fermentarium]|uniref:cyclic nucleotide-binding domain-containing protein n=1 Tax=Azospirillum fermentarium TaxID=1233114 RepID=UPI0022272F8A|nr:cyclic nucleotide-binding domain-containing protein [Azospirillum fermentarium]MCW2247909.1 CRP-like cAMP-binding protein [Azospirillum fermentarium]